jgi:hypothetical protein
MATCPNCGKENPEGFRFCGFCAAPLGEAPSGEERKVVSVLFCDLVGFTAHSDRADPEDVRPAGRGSRDRGRGQWEPVEWTDDTRWRFRALLSPLYGQRW